MYGDKRTLSFYQAGIYTPAGFFYPHYDEAYDGDDVRSRKRIASSIIYVRYLIHFFLILDFIHFRHNDQKWLGSYILISFSAF